MKKILAVAAIFLFAVGTLAYSQSGQKALGVFAYVGDIELFNNAPTSDFNTAIGESPTIRFDGSAGEIELGPGNSTEPDVVLSRTAANTLGLADGDSFVSGSTYRVSFVSGPLATNSVDQIAFIADRAATITDIDAVWGTAESAGTVGIMPERLQGTEAVASGDDLLTTAFDGTATANTVVNGTLTATTANLTLAAGDRIGIDFTDDTPGELLNVVITFTLRVD